MANSLEHGQLGAPQVRYRSPGDLDRNISVVGPPDQVHRLPDLTELCLVALIDNGHQDVTHHTASGPIVGRPVPLSGQLHPVVTDPSDTVQGPDHPIGERSGSTAVSCAPEQWNSDQDQSPDLVRRQHSQVHRHPPPERMADQDHRLIEFVKYRRDHPRVACCPNGFCRFGRGSETRQIDGHRVQATQHLIEIPTVSPPAVQSQHLRWTVPKSFTEDGSTGK